MTQEKIEQRGEEAARWLESKSIEMDDALAQLVEVNSFTENVEGGRSVGALLTSLFAIKGLTVERRSSARFADHLVAGSSSSRETQARPLALLGHLDTVFPPGTFEGYRRDGDLRRGPGVLDMKGGLVVVAYALRALSEVVGLEAMPPLRLVVVADEEIGSPESQAIIRETIAQCKACLVFESGRASDAIITRRKGTGFLKVVARGRAAHAGNAHKDGHNAIWALARFIDRVQRLTDYDRGITVNVGKVSGGQSKNTVPDHAEAQVDLRFCTVADAEALVERVRVEAREASVEIAGTLIEVDGGVARLPLERTDESVSLMKEYAACARASGLGDSEAGLIGGGSDASTSSAMGIASIDGLGPRGIGFHTKDEQIEVRSLIPKAQALARFVSGWH
ncbi:MAG: M20 family metallopeptidase [Polyangiales bacterium]